MNNPYDTHSWSKLYRKERLRDARTTHLEGRLRENHKAQSGRSSLSLAFANMLSLVRGA